MSTVFNKQAKDSRRNEQIAHFEVVQQLPTRAHAGALHALWPQRLPKVVRARLDSALREQWRKLRTEAIEQRIAKELREIDAMEAELDDLMVEMHERQELCEMMDQYGDEAQEISKIVASLPDIKSVTILLSNNRSRKFSFDEGEDMEDELLMGFCMALDMGGGIVLRHSLPLRTQVKGSDGQMTWLNQERIYGIVCGEGQYRGLTKAEIKESYIVDGEGNLLEHDPVVNFGNAKELLRARK